MITFNFIFEDEAANAFKERLHNALVGSPAYVESEIAICDGDTVNDFYLIIGNDNKDNITLKVFADNSFTVKNIINSNQLDIIAKTDLHW